QPLPEPPGRGVHRRLQHRVLGRKVVLHSADRDVGPGGDLTHRHALESVADEDAQHDVDHAVVLLAHVHLAVARPRRYQHQYVRMVACAAMASPRYVSLDVLRGIAILGTLGTNIWIYTTPDGLIGYLQGDAAAPGAWRPVEVVLQQLTQGKFLGLLTVMFGIGLALQQRSALR